MEDKSKNEDNLPSPIGAAFAGGKLEEQRQIQRLMQIEDAYTPMASRYFTWLEKTGYGLVDGLQPYLAYLRQTYRSARSIATYIAAAKNRVRLVLWTMRPDVRLQVQDMLANIRGDKSERSIDESKILTPEEIDNLLEGLGGESSRVAGATTIGYAIEFLRATGCRISELIDCRLVDIVEHEKGKIWLRVHGKGRKERFLRFPAGNLLGRIKNHFEGKIWLFEHGGKQFNRHYFTQGISRAAQNILDRDGVSAHTLRHSWATQAVKRGIAIKKISRYLGHASTSITLDMYTHIAMEDSDVNEMWNKKNNDDL